MALKDAVNSVLQQTTGYRLTRETPAQRQAALDAAAERIRAEVAAERRRRREANERRRREAEAQKAASQQRAAVERAARLARGDDLPEHFDDEKRRIIAQVRPRTMTGVPKLEPLIEATRYVVRHQIPGDVVECGVWRGGSMQAIALTLLGQGDSERELHLFDTFEGMPPPTEHDTKVRDGVTRSAEEMLARTTRDSRVWAVAGLDDVKQAMDETGYPSDKIHYHPGLVEDTTPGEAPERISILRLDTDWYASTLHELEHLYDRLSPGGVLILDDYSDWDGARKATEEWLQKTGEPLYLGPIGMGRLAIKPFGPRD